MDKEYYKKERKELQNAIIKFERNTVELFSAWKYRHLKTMCPKEHLHWENLYDEALLLLMHVEECCSYMPAPSIYSDNYGYNLVCDYEKYFDELYFMKHTLDSGHEGYQH